MKKLFLLLALLLGTNIYAGTPVTDTSIFTVPKVSNWNVAQGTFLLTQDIKINISDNTLLNAKDYLQKSLPQAGACVTGHANGVINLSIVKNKKLGKEGYILKVKDNQIDIQGCTPQSVLWGIQTIFQMSAANTEIPCGTITDHPDYALRGLLMDCGRKFIPMDYLYQLVRTMSYYKMNTLQIHLNDNGFPKYTNNNWSETYSAFRLESERFPLLTATDGSYTKKEFRQFILWAETMGVEIIPEIDVPAHSLAFTKIRPEYKGYKPDHLDIMNPRVTEFIDTLFAEYLEGPEPVFCGKRVHIGTDEYNNTEQDVVEAFRALSDHLIRFVEGYGKQAVLWGSLTHADGATPVKVDNVLMQMWSTQYADPIEMKKAGYQMVSIPDGLTYIVPAAGYYYDYLNCRYLYLNWTPAVVASNEKFHFQDLDPQIEGGMFAVWNDVCGNGISIGDIHHRLFPALQVIAEKTWRSIQPHTSAAAAYAQWNNLRSKLGEGPGVDELGNLQLNLPVLQSNTTLKNTAGQYQLGYDYKVEFDIDWAEESEGTCLTISPRAKFFLSDPINGNMAFLRDGYLYTFHHTGRKGVKEHIAIIGTNKSTKLLVNGEVVSELNYEVRMDATNKPYNVVRTLVFPLESTGKFHSQITNFKAQHTGK